MWSCGQQPQLIKCTAKICLPLLPYRNHGAVGKSWSGAVHVLQGRGSAAAASGCVSGGEVYTAHQTTTACGSGICLLFYLMSGVLCTPHSLFTPAPLAIVSPRAETGAAGALAPPADRGGGATRMHLLRQWLPSAASGQEALGRAAHQDVHAGWQRDRGRRDANARP